MATWAGRYYHRATLRLPLALTGSCPVTGDTRGRRGIFDVTQTGTGRVNAKLRG